MFTREDNRSYPVCQQLLSDATSDNILYVPVLPWNNNILTKPMAIGLWANGGFEVLESILSGLMGSAVAGHGECRRFLVGCQNGSLPGEIMG